MSDEAERRLRFRPRARIIRTIGDQLISGPEAAVIELVKNAYDADASFVWIRYTPPLLPGEGRISIADDGHGMSLEDIRNKWMEPATPSKISRQLSPSRKRTLMGSKGIGRFAAAKLGRKLALNSVSAGPFRNTEVLIPEIDWAIFDGDTYLSDVAIEYLLQETDDSTGTEIEVRELSETWTATKLRRLHLELRRLISPFSRGSDEDQFKIYLDLSGCNIANAGFDGYDLFDAPRELGPGDGRSPPPAFEVLPFPLLTTCDYEVSGVFDENGKFSGSMEVRRGGQAPIPLDLHVSLQEDEDPCGLVGVQLYIFDREAETLKRTMARAGLGEMTAAEARRILDDIAGVAIYRSGFRVRPYGDPENDWLTLDRRRVQDPSLRIGHNQIAGYVTVQGQAESGLVERSSREGFEQNAAFTRLGRLLTQLLTERVEPRRYDFRKQAGLSRSRNTTFDEVKQLSGLQKIRELIGRLPPTEQAQAEAVIRRESAQLVEKISILEERQRVLEAKSSLGAIISEVLHEGGPAVAYLLATSARLQVLVPDALNNTPNAQAARELIPDRLFHMRKNSQRLADLFKALRPLSGGRRGKAVWFKPVDPIFSARALFETHETEIIIEGGFDAPEIVGYPDDLLTAAVNLFSNAIYWLESTQTCNPRITVRLFTQGSDLVIYIEDNGPGIPAEFAEHIFDVGFSLKPDGTGLGLNIAREALARSEGKLGYHLDYDGGARFEIRFPLPPSKLKGHL